ncbi:hypothetical protein DM01DRAFT_1335814 [Hesseltinella vesiculosa]|uniref:E3 ubiquitin protein ligase n=1 Tax=Hesseltinella vesiculosa TaxID=101127 RepID=A0A1X2GHH7_9FUNG|nr:hypothetical protein DM01DRAFT_1335814 [Hesseltinella vesiculosa]
MASSDHKRRWPESNPGVPSRPLKKRFTSTNVMPPTTPSEPPQQQPQIDNIAVKPLSKEDWLQKLKGAKMQCQDLTAKDTTVDADTRQLEAMYGLLRVQWNLVQRDLYMIAKSNVMSNVPSLDDLPSHTPFTERGTLEKSHDIAKELQTLILNQLKAWLHEATELEQASKSADTNQQQLCNWLDKEIKDLRGLRENGRQFLLELEERQRQLAQQSDHMESQIAAKAQELEQNQDTIDTCVASLKQAQRRYDRSRSKVLATVASGGIDDLTEDDLDVVYTGPVAPVRRSATPDDAPSSSDANDDTNQPPSDPANTIDLAQLARKQQLDEYKLLIQARDKTILDMKQDRERLLNDMDRFHQQLDQLPDERITSTEYYKNLQSSVDYYRHRGDQLEQARNALDRSLDDLARTRQRWDDEVHSEKTSEDAAMDIERKRLESDLVRIRSQRDAFQTQYKDMQAKEAKIRDVQAQIIEAAQNQKEYIATLESRLQQLKMDTSVAGPLEDNLKAYQNLQLSICHNQNVLERLKGMEEQCDPIESQSRISQLKTQVNQLQQALDAWPAKDSPTYQVMVDLADAASEMKKSSLLVDMYEKTESQLLDQMDRVGAIYGRLEEQGARKIFSEPFKPDLKGKLQAEKSKFAQTFPSLVAAKEKQQNNVSTLRMTCEKQMKLVVQLQEREKSLRIQLADKEFAALRKSQALEEDKNTVDDLTQQVDEAKLTLEQLEEHLTEVQKLVKDKTRAMEEEKKLASQVQDEHEKLKRRWELTSHGDNPQEQQLVEECEELRSLLKCSTCKTRFRSHLITRCMHTFCKRCIDDRIETRQRRCPTCGEAFGSTDVRQFFL